MMTWEERRGGREKQMLAVWGERDSIECSWSSRAGESRECVVAGSRRKRREGKKAKKQGRSSKRVTGSSVAQEGAVGCWENNPQFEER